MRLIYTLFLLGSLTPAGAQSGVGMPVLGFAFDPSFGAIRQIVGMAGAAVLGPVLTPGFALRSAAISPRQDFALVVSAEDAGVRIIRFDSDTAVVPLAGGMSSPDRMILSPAGSAAVLYRQDSSRIQILTGLPGSPEIRDASTAGLNSGSVVAITDDGNLALVAGQDSDPSWTVGSDGSFVPLALPASAVTFAFRRDSHDLLAATRAGDVYLARDVDTSPAFLRIGAVAAEPVGAQFSSDGAVAYALGPDGTVLAVDLASNSSRTISCGCRPTALEALRSGTFRLTGISSRPLMLLDASAELRVWFVPPDPAPAESSDPPTKGPARERVLHFMEKNQ